MHGDFKDPIIPMHFALRIYRNGTINYLMRYNELMCNRMRKFFQLEEFQTHKNAVELFSSVIAGDT
jgi:hypothetical protein